MPGLKKAWAQKLKAQGFYGFKQILVVTEKLKLV